MKAKVNKGIYKGLSKKEILNKIQLKGFGPTVINDKPERIYSPHSHPEDKLIVILEGEMEVTVEDKKYLIREGDELIIPGGMLHSAKTGEKGCRFFWSEKLTKSA